MRFREAQDAAYGGFASALAELRAGRKRGHWIWYVFPQLAGLGHSPTAVHYGLTGADEATAYLRDDVLGERLVTAAAAVRQHLESATPISTLMGSHIDALKLVSSMTLFAHVATRPGGDPRFASMAAHADAILEAAARQGYRRCTFTEGRLTIGR